MNHQAILGKTSTLVDTQLCILFTDQLYCTYEAEKGLSESLSALRSSANMEELKELLEEYLLKSEKQAIRLEEIFGILLIPFNSEHCDRVQGLKREINRVAKQPENDGISHDAALISVVQKIIRYKLGSYKKLEQLAISLGMEDTSYLLNQSYHNEKESDLLFSDIAERSFNFLVEAE